jgi:hypothetical protein
MSLEHSPARERKAAGTPEVSDPSYTINGFCRAERISRSLLYELWRQGKGPDFYWAGVTRRITHRARLAWQREREAAARKLAAAEQGDEAA